MRGSRNFRQGRGGGRVRVNLTKKLWKPFFRPQLILQSQMVNFKENYHFSRLPRGSNIFQGGPTFSGVGGSNCLFLKKIYNLWFSGGGPDPLPPPPLDPHLGLSMVLSIHAENAPNLTKVLRYVSGRTGGQTDRQTDGCIDGRRQNNIPPTSSGKPILITGYLVSCSRTQRSASGEARTRNPSISGQALYHDCALQLGSILCRYDTCPTQYAPDLRGSILCMQGTQYAPRESILCMEHFVALQRTFARPKQLNNSSQNYK